MVRSRCICRNIRKRHPLIRSLGNLFIIFIFKLLSGGHSTLKFDDLRTMDSKPSLLILGIGNPLRGDDGIGAHICAQLEQLNIPRVSVQTTHQLHTEWIYTFRQYDVVLLVDASLLDQEVVIRPISTTPVSSVNLSHHVAASQIAALTSLIVGSATLFFECAVPGDAFGLSDRLSEKGRMHADLAVTSILDWLEDLPSS